MYKDRHMLMISIIVIHMNNLDYLYMIFKIYSIHNLYMFWLYEVMHICVWNDL